MYRDLYTMLLCVSAVLAAPQQDSNITYIRRQDEQVNNEPEFRHKVRETRISDLPLIVSDNYSDVNQKGLTNNPLKDTESEVPNEPTKEPLQLYNYSDRIYSIKNKKNKKNTTDTITATPVPAATEAHILNLDILPEETLHTSLQTKYENVTEKIETEVTNKNESVTEQYTNTPILHTQTDIETTKEPIVTFPPKSSYYGKSNMKSFSHNLISASGKRRFRSRCKCEKIWNCAKLQVSVARCPDEYFLCCG